MKIGIGISIPKYKNRGAAYGVATQLVLDYASSEGYTIPTTETLTHYDTLLISMNDAGWLDVLDFFYIIAVDNDAINFSRINIVNPGTYNATAQGTPGFVNKQGTTWNSGNNCLSSNFTPSINGSNFTLNDNCFFAWYNGTPTADSSNTEYVFGGRSSGTNATTYIRAVDNNNRQHTSNNGATGIFVNAPITGSLIASVRTASNADALYKNGTSQVTGTGNVVELCNRPLFIGAWNVGSVNSPSKNPISFAGGGASFASGQGDLYTFLNTYLTSI